MATRREDLAAALTNAEENGGEMAQDFVMPSSNGEGDDPSLAASAGVVREGAQPNEGGADEATRTRDASGRFAPKQDAASIAASTAATSAPQLPDTQSQRPEAPKSWKAEYKATWDKLDPSIAGYISQREQEMSRGHDEFKQKAEPALSLFQEITPFVQDATQRGLNMQQFVAETRGLFQTRDALYKGDQQTKLQTLVNLAHNIGIPLAQMLQGQVPPQMQQALDPNYMALKQQIDAVQGHLTNQQHMQQQRAQHEIETEIGSFAQSHPHFEALRDDMARLLQAGVVSDLDGAYSKALRLNDNLFQQTQAQQREADEKARRLAADKAAKGARSNAVSTRTATPGSVAATTGGAPKGRRAALEDAFSQATTGRI